jgi:hypothetical protein
MCRFVQCILVSLDSGAVERSPEPNWMGWQAEGEALRAQVDIGPLVGIERFLTWGSEQGCGWLGGVEIVPGQEATPSRQDA